MSTLASTLPGPPALEPLSVLLRTGSQAEHTETESSGFVTELMDGRVDEAGYAAYLSRLLAVYEALEEVGARIATGPDADPVAAAVHDTRLVRVQALRDDLAHWAGPGWESSLQPSPAADAYAARIRESVAAWPALYVAHHYTRYLGDLSGGQVIGRVLTRTFGLEPGAGVSFYRFAEVPKPKPYKDAYRARLDALDLDQSARVRMLAEVRVAFRHNGALFAELGAQLDRWRRHP